MLYAVVFRDFVLVDRLYRLSAIASMVGGVAKPGWYDVVKHTIRGEEEGVAC